MSRGYGMDNYQLILILFTSCNLLCKYDNARFTTVTLKSLTDHRSQRTLCVYLSNCVRIAVKRECTLAYSVKYFLNIKQFAVLNNHKRFCRLKRVCPTSLINQRFK